MYRRASVTVLENDESTIRWTLYVTELLFIFWNIAPRSSTRAFRNAIIPPESEFSSSLSLSILQSYVALAHGSFLFFFSSSSAPKESRQN